MVAVFLLFHILGFNQTCFKVVYKGIYIIPGQTFNVDVDSATASYFNSLDSNWKQSLIEKTSQQVLWNLNVQLQDSVSYLEPKIVKKPTYVNINGLERKLKLTNDGIYQWDNDLSVWQYHNDSSRSYRYEITGRTKKILSYDCYEAIYHKNEFLQTLWLCKELPALLSPGIKCNLPGAILEWSNNSIHYIVMTINNCD